MMVMTWFMLPVSWACLLRGIVASLGIVVVSNVIVVVALACRFAVNRIWMDSTAIELLYSIGIHCTLIFSNWSSLFQLVFFVIIINKQRVSIKLQLID
jgi:hypothetical protein